MRRALTVILAALLSGIFFVAGALAGGAIAQRPGLIIGAAVGGVIGGLLIPLLLARFKLVRWSLTTVLGSEIGIMLTYALAATNLDKPLVCFASTLVFGVFVTLGDALKKQ